MFGRNASEDRGAARRAAAQTGAKSGPGADRCFEIVALWSESAAQLRRAIENETDWGPFELTGAAPLGRNAFGAMRYLCRFEYHGDERTRPHFETDLRTRLSSIACWQEAASAGTGNST